MSENFRDPIALLRAAETHGLEGIVSKLREDRYRSGKNTVGEGENGDVARGEPRALQAVRKELGPPCCLPLHARDVCLTGA